VTRGIAIAGICFAAAAAHDIITTTITWDREISRIVYARCARCHHPGGAAFSLLTYSDARPWAVAIKEEVEERRMPPWGAVKGFGDFRNDESLTPEQIELIVSWVSGGVPEGNAADLPQTPAFADAEIPKPSREGLTLRGDTVLRAPIVLDGLSLLDVPDGASFQVTAEVQGGAIEPLLWVFQYKSEFAHPFLLRTPLRLPRGAAIRGIPPGMSVLLLEATRGGPRARQSARY
jgi:mono/diheme cytochrome c family protein